MPDLPHGIEYYAALWEEACRRGHDPQAYLHDERMAASATNTITSAVSVCDSGQGSMTGGKVSKPPSEKDFKRDRPPTPPKPKSGRRSQGTSSSGTCQTK